LRIHCNDAYVGSTINVPNKPSPVSGLASQSFKMGLDISRRHKFNLNLHYYK
jgi:hypothetical protein